MLKSASNFPFALKVCKSFILNINAIFLTMFKIFVISAPDLKFISIFGLLPVLITPFICETSFSAV